VGILHPVEVDHEAKVLGGRDLFHQSFHEQGVGAQVYELLLGRDPAHDLGDLRVQRGLAAGDGNDGRAGLLHRRQALLDGQHLVDDGLVFTNPATPLARQIALLERFQHGHEGEAAAARDLVLRQVPRQPNRDFQRSGHLPFSSPATPHRLHGAFVR